MKITALRMHNVKRFAGRGVAIEGMGDGVNALCAANEFGKSTSFEALHGLFFLPHGSVAAGVKNLRPYSGGNPLVEADVVVGDKQYRITKQYYGGRFAKVADLSNGRLLYQADEAENFIGTLMGGGASGPAGLLWVRQGLTGLEQRGRAAEEQDQSVRATLLQSVQGEVEAVTGGRRMAEVIAATEEARGALVTAQGRPRAGGRYANAIEERKRLVEAEQGLAQEVQSLRNQLDERAAVVRQLAELEDGDAQEERRAAIVQAQAEYDAARVQAEQLKVALAELNLARDRRDNAARAHEQFADAMAQVATLAVEREAAIKRRDDAITRRHTALETIAAAQTRAEQAEAQEAELRILLDRLAAAERARDAAARRSEAEAALARAEALRQTLETAEARLAQVQLPAKLVEDLAKLDIEIARISAVRAAARPSVTIAYDAGATANVTLDGVVLGDGEERGYDGQAQLVAPGVGRLTLRSNHSDRDDGLLEAAEEKRAALLAKLGVADLAAARAQQQLAQEIAARANDARAQLKVLAPDGLEKLRAAVVELANVTPVPMEFKADPEETRLACEAAQQSRRDAAQEVKTAEPAREQAESRYVDAQAELAKLAAKEDQIAAILGPVDGREARGAQLAAALDECAQNLASAQSRVDQLQRATADLDAAHAKLSRLRSVDDAMTSQLQQLKEKLAGLNAAITARSDDAVEENWRQTAEALEAAEARVAGFEQEVAVLDRLKSALEAARTSARDQYLKPVVQELHPLLGLLFDDAEITFDDRSLLPQTIMRAGLEEEVERLSGGMREQLSILTRLAFARLLARDGRPAPVILDDALVYSDDDRIERMFDALHRQAQDQQIIVFSCRQRAFARLGGTPLQMTDWTPQL